MSRGQQDQTYDAAKTQDQGYYSQAQNSYTKAQNDVGDYEDQLSKYAASNPYGQGGQFQKTTNQIVANTADAKARAAGQMLQGEALRTGGNSAGGIAATENMTQQATRDISGEEAQANQERIGAGAQYGKSVLGATEVPEQMEASLTGQQANAGTGTLGIEQKAGDTPSWGDEFGDAFGQSLGKAAGQLVSTGVSKIPGM